MSQTHPITGVTTLTIAGEVRTLACDMNSAAVLHEQLGDKWPAWLTARFIGIPADGGRRVEALTPADLRLTLLAVLASDRMDNPRSDESPGSLARSIGIGGYAEAQTEVLRCVMTSFGLPGKAVDAVLAAMDARRENSPAAGTGLASSPLPSEPSVSPRIASGASRSRSGTESSTVTPSASKTSARKKRGSYPTL